MLVSLHPILEPQLSIASPNFARRAAELTPGKKEITVVAERFEAGIVLEDLITRSESMIALNGSFLSRGGRASLHCALLACMFVIALGGWLLVYGQALSEKSVRARAQLLSSDVPVSFPERLVVTPSGKAYLLDTDLSTLFILDNKDRRMKGVCGSETLSSPSDITLDRKGSTGFHLRVNLNLSLSAAVASLPR